MTKKKYDILIVDDTKTMRMIVQAVLSGMDSHFDLAVDGMEAYEYIKKKQYDLIISDIHMPRMSGLELCNKARLELKFKNLPILIMTTDNSYDTVQKVFQAGATDFINKPINELELTSRVDRLLEQRRVEKELYIAQSGAEKANLRKSRYLANVNHELKTPLNGIYGYAQVLQSMEADPEKLVMLNMMVKASEQMTSMINQLLELEQIETGRIELKKVDIAVFDMVERCVSINLPSIHNKGVSINLEVDNSLVINSDEDMFYSIFTNLLTNAIKYNKSAGTIHIQSSKEGDDVWLHIRDTGVGMNKDQVARIFEPFIRFEGDNSQAEGHGLGMAITKSSVDALGMHMRIDSEVNKGTSVSLQIA
ncbi:MAG: hybrid sensor histidine kinase/response regulator [Algicola sp.]|nr:hybrid sensor histidine kinase/response regulator [Algicola sp.]